MPFKSQAQRRWMFANEPEMAKRWAKETPKGKKLPEKVKKKKQLGGNPWGPPEEEDLIEGVHVPYGTFEQPKQRSGVEDAIYKGIIATPNGYESAQSAYDHFNPKKTEIDTKNPWSPYFALRGAANATSFISGVMERKRQNNYMYDQFSTLGQLEPANLQDYQPNRFSMYAKYGGKLKDYFNG